MVILFPRLVYLANIRSRVHLPNNCLSLWLCFHESYIWPCHLSEDINCHQTHHSSDCRVETGRGYIKQVSMWQITNTALQECRACDLASSQKRCLPSVPYVGRKLKIKKIKKSYADEWDLINGISANDFEVRIPNIVIWTQTLRLGMRVSSDEEFHCTCKLTVMSEQ